MALHSALLLLAIAAAGPSEAPPAKGGVVVVDIVSPGGADEALTAQVASLIEDEAPSSVAWLERAPKDAAPCGPDAACLGGYASRGARWVVHGRVAGDLLELYVLDVQRGAVDTSEVGVRQRGSALRASPAELADALAATWPEGTWSDLGAGNNTSSGRRAPADDDDEGGIPSWVWVVGCGGVLLAVGVVGFVLAVAVGLIYVIGLVVLGANLFEQLVCTPLCGALCGLFNIPGLCAMTCGNVLGDLTGGCNVLGGACSGVGDSCSGCSGPSCSGLSVLAAPAAVPPATGLSGAAMAPALASVPAGAMLY